MDVFAATRGPGRSIADTIFTGLGTTITTADELLQLPSDEQRHARFHKRRRTRQSLSALTNQTKRAIVDTLEHFGNTAALMSMIA